MITNQRVNTLVMQTRVTLGTRRDHTTPGKPIIRTKVIYSMILWARTGVHWGLNLASCRNTARVQARRKLLIMMEMILAMIVHPTKNLGGKMMTTTKTRPLWICLQETSTKPALAMLNLMPLILLILTMHSKAELPQMRLVILKVLPLLTSRILRRSYRRKMTLMRFLVALQVSWMNWMIYHPCLNRKNKRPMALLQLRNHRTRATQRMALLRWLRRKSQCRSLKKKSKNQLSTGNPLQMLKIR
mmetsp:Transcript_5709/g.12052  ORF Transcript_5709/g.12052 Transcript_5709/m.12052 type:complete len:244 (+) Transcript_5709:2894-3625(+)